MSGCDECAKKHRRIAMYGVIGGALITGAVVFVVMSHASTSSSPS